MIFNVYVLSMKNKGLYKNFLFTLIMVFVFVLNNPAYPDSEIDYETEYNFYTGMFDFSDTGKKSSLFGLQHEDKELFRNSFLGKISPITGGMFTADNSIYVYTGIKAEYDLGLFKIVPSFTPGLYGEGDGKDLGSPLEFKSEVQMTFNLSEKSHLGMSYNHISNASLGDKNPGANSYMFNFLKKF